MAIWNYFQTWLPELGDRHNCANVAQILCVGLSLADHKVADIDEDGEGLGEEEEEEMGDEETEEGEEKPSPPTGISKSVIGRLLST